ncbi:MAG: ribonuclease D [Geminicoccaceae bacterium]|nr:ribonuclease D [Geminicoccaceae bacterium]
MTLLTTTDEIASLCDELAGEPYVAIDTEFMRDRTYYPKLCLVQLAGRERPVAIDPLAPGVSLEPLIRLLDDPTVVKVFHAARQDIEIFYRLTGRVPAPLFDTQLAAMVLGFGEEVGYESLVQQVAKARVDKSSRFTDWSRRPLSSQQLDYALSDVIHLRVVYERLNRRLTESGRASWLDEELAGLTDPEAYEQAPEAAWKRIKVRSREPRFLAIVQALAAWREREAQRRDLPRARVLRDDILLEVAANRPASATAVNNLRRVSVDQASARGISSAVEGALALPDDQLPRPAPPPKLPRGIGPLVDLLRTLLKFSCERHEVAQRLVANTDDLEQIAAFDEPDVPALKGWRRQVFGEAALALKRGEIAFLVERGKVRIVEVAALAAAD